jgi:hypothetical protein
MGLSHGDFTICKAAGHNGGEREQGKVNRQGWGWNTHLSHGPGFLPFVNGVSHYIGAGHTIAQPHHGCGHQRSERFPHLVGIAWRKGTFNSAATRECQGRVAVILGSWVTDLGK